MSNTVYICKHCKRQLEDKESMVVTFGRNHGLDCPRYVAPKR